MPEMPNADLLRSLLTGTLETDLSHLKTILNCPENDDIIIRPFEAGGFSLCAVYMDGMANPSLIADFILRACFLINEKAADVPPESRSEFLLNNSISIPEAKIENRLGEIVAQILGGMTVLIVDGCFDGLLLETRGFEKRTVDRTVNESVIIGSQEGFVESLRTNLTLMRRYVQSPSLIAEKMTVGTKVPLNISIMYMKDVADERVIEEMRRRLKTIDSATVHGLGAIKQMIEDNPLALLPQMMMTERPDRAASCVLDGQIIVLADSSPYALIAPISMFHLLHSSDDSFMRWQYGSFQRVIRMLGILFAALLPATYVALARFHPHLIPMSLLTSIAETRANVPFTVLTEVIIMEISYFLINEASTRVPSQMGQVIGIVGALILGQAAVAASIISPIVIIIVALTGLGNYAVPNYELTIGMTILRISLVLIAAILGLYGIILTVFLLVCHLCSMRSLGVPYLSPVAPYRPHNPDIILRLPLWLQKLPLFVVKRNSWIRKEDKK